MKTDDILIGEANLVYNETVANANSHIRVGGLFQDLVTSKVSLRDIYIASNIDNYSVTLPTSLGIASYLFGQKFTILFTNANTGAATINFNSLGNVNLVKNGSTPLSSGDINTGQLFWVIYDGTNFQLLGIGGSGGSVAGTVISKGAWNASTNAVPSNGDATIKQGFMYDNGNFSSTTLLAPDGNVILPYAIIRALVDNPGPLLTDQTKWRLTY